MFSIHHDQSIMSTTFILKLQIVVPKEIHFSEWSYESPLEMTLHNDSLDCSASFAVTDEFLSGYTTFWQMHFVMTRLFDYAFHDVDEENLHKTLPYLSDIFSDEWWLKMGGLSKFEVAQMMRDIINNYIDAEKPVSDFHSGGIVPSHKTVKYGQDARTHVPMLAEKFSVLDEVVSFPRGCTLSGKDTLSNIIQYLNDREGWSREDIADWLESLDINLEIQ